ncbi:membrane protein insertase YidC [Dactylococcopsis salina]|uniref:Membrane protein insertase, YidC/Oxa1 family, C-terminal domain protein n=1 Tax=Dactylococcopsis salina (strain PCC 8305) TaxID=13035 RepID=K9YW19_DACS8|nr:membrane protein insertase YidC [Dactylococcopsis salina]AFZ50687.1 membrane protein insertase, YidC/Oxa1 family, C-terminal domain protein [Dactylococcopsis salina PCC 8305]
MDFGIGFISNNIMLPILDFFHGIVPSYGFAIIALTLVIRFALYPLSAKSIRSMRRMRVAQPAMQKKVKEVQERYKDDPEKQRQEMSAVYKEYGNPLAGCFPVILQMPILFALFATLRGSPFADVDYTVDMQIFPREQIESVQPETVTTKAENVYINEDVHYKVLALLPSENLGVGQTTQLEFQTEEGKSLNQLNAETESNLAPNLEVVKGQERVKINEDGTISAIAPGEVSIKASLPGVAKNEGFIFIEALGRVGAVGEDGTIHWDILGMVIFFGISLYANQKLSGQSNKSGDNSQQQLISQITPILFTGMFLFFPLPAGVLMYIVLANVFQTLQTLILMREPLPDNLQKIVEEQEKQEKKEKGQESLPFEKQKRSRKKEKASG